MQLQERRRLQMRALFLKQKKKKQHDLRQKLQQRHLAEEQANPKAVAEKLKIGVSAVL